MIPYKASPDGLKFRIILKDYFRDENAARVWMDRIPDGYADGARLFSQWPQDAVFYSDPYLRATPPLRELSIAH